MDSNPRGLAVIINNKIFVNMDDRSGTHCDLRMLKNLFTQLKFTVEEHNNRSADVSNGIFVHRYTGWAKNGLFYKFVSPIYVDIE